MALNRMLLCILFCAFTCTVTAASPTEDCGSTVGAFTHASISNCPDSAPVCVLKKKTNVTLDIFFTTNTTDHSVKADVHGILEGVPVPWPVPRPDACTKSGLTCPLQPGQTYHYTAMFPVKSSYPSLSLQVKWELKNENNADIVCILFPVKIK